MKDELLTDAEPAPSGRPSPPPHRDGGTTKGHRASRGEPSSGRARQDEGVLVTRWDFTWRAVTLRMADALAQRIASPPTRTPRAPHGRGRWALGAAAAAAAYARSRGWL